MKGQTVVHVAARRCECKVLEFLFSGDFAIPIDFVQEDWNGQTPYECIPRRDFGGDLDGTREFFKNNVLPQITT